MALEGLHLNSENIAPERLSKMVQTFGRGDSFCGDAKDLCFTVRHFPPACLPLRPGISVQESHANPLDFHCIGSAAQRFLLGLCDTFALSTRYFFFFALLWALRQQSGDYQATILKSTSARDQ